MGEYSVKLDRLIPVMNDYIGKLQTFDSIVTNEKKTGAIREILTLVEDLRNCLKINSSINNNETQTLYSNQIERIFSEFNWNVNYTIKRNEFSKFLGCCKSLAASVMKIIGKRNCGILIVEMHFQMCIRLVNELYHSVEENTNVLKDLLLFQLLVKGFSSSFKSLKKFWYVIIPSNQKCSVLLCVNQCFKTLSFLGNVIDKRLKQLILYLLNRLKQCINKIFDILYGQEEQTSNSEFINLMDTCLVKLEKLGYSANFEEDMNDETDELVSSLKVLLDELLCHGMIVSHVSTREIDCNSIKLHSQKVLDEFENLNKIENRHDIKSICDNLSDVLCQLEEVVNIAVLNAVLDLFIDVNDPLRNLLNKCDVSGDGFNKTASDLEDEITNFDELMDKIINIGLFAISCSTDVVRTFKIRNCLASLESLEVEMIPSVVSLYLNPNSETRSTFQFIFKNWMEEVTELKTLVDLIIDPAAFSQVVLKRISALVYELRSDSTPPLEKIKSSLTQILSYSKKLLKTLTRSTEHDDEEIQKKLKASIESLQLAHQECSASLKLLDEDIPANEILNRILKRADLITSSINNLINNFNDSWNESEYLEGDPYDDWLAPSLPPHKWERDDEKLDKLDIYKLNAITPEPEDPIDQEILTPYINKGKIRSKEWTIMYNTPKRKQSTPGVFNSTNRRDIPRGSCRRKRFCKTLSNNSELENSLDLELTALLDNVTDLDDTFATTIGKSSEPGNDEGVHPLREPEAPAIPVREPENTGDEKVFLGTLMREKLDQSLSDLSNSDSLSIQTDSSFRYETPERMNDLGIVQKKINFLMEHIND